MRYPVARYALRAAILIAAAAGVWTLAEQADQHMALAADAHPPGAIAQVLETAGEADDIPTVRPALSTPQRPMLKLVHERPARPDDTPPLPVAAALVHSATAPVRGVVAAPEVRKVVSPSLRAPAPDITDTAPLPATRLCLCELLPSVETPLLPVRLSLVAAVPPTGPTTSAAAAAASPVTVEGDPGQVRVHHAAPSQPHDGTQPTSRRAGGAKAKALHYMAPAQPGGSNPRQESRATGGTSPVPGSPSAEPPMWTPEPGSSGVTAASSSPRTRWRDRPMVRPA